MRNVKKKTIFLHFVFYFLFKNVNFSPGNLSPDNLSQTYFLCKTGTEQDKTVNSKREETNIWS